MSQPNQTKLKVFAGVLHLENFTVAELCLYTGLTSSMVYRELSNLQERSILKTVNREAKIDAPGPRHRPPRHYEIVDGSKRKVLRNELDSFLPEGAEEPFGNRYLIAAQSRLTQISNELFGKELQSVTESRLQEWDKEISHQFAELETELRRATWESPADLSESVSEDEPLLQAQQLYQHLRDEYRQKLRAERERREAAYVRKTWGAIVVDVAGKLIPEILSNSIPWITSPAFFIVARHAIEHSVARRRELKPEHDEKLRAFASSLLLELRDVRSQADGLGALAKHTIEYGNAIHEPLHVVQKMLEVGSQDYRLSFNEANLEFLACKFDRAYHSWVKFLDARWTRGSEAPALIARVPHDRWSNEAYRGAVHSLTYNCRATVSVFSQSPIDVDEDYLVRPQLYNPLREPDRYQNSLIPISEPLVGGYRGLYVSSSYAERMMLPGVPTLICATLLAYYVKREYAWKFATDLKSDDRIVKVDFVGAADEATCERAEQILKGALSAEIVNSR